ncbi:MAG: LysM peptidoglycan-binding domain-containing protein [Planctomycetota bacterium]
MNGHAVDPNRLLPGTEVKVPRDPDNVQGASMDDGEPDPEPETTHTDYIVSKDDSLWTIAKALYGSGVKWTVIRDANRDLVGDQGQRLRPGMVLKIPPPPGG